MPLGLPFHSHQVRHLHFLTSGLCCSAGLWRRILIGWAQSSPITAPLWLQRQELLVEGTLWSEAVFHTPHGAQWVPALSRLCDCCPEGQCSLLPSWSCLLFSEHCSCSDMESRPQQGSSVPICWQCLLEHFCWGKKRSLVKREEGKVHLVLESSPTTKWKVHSSAFSVQICALRWWGLLWK